MACGGCCREPIVFTLAEVLGFVALSGLGLAGYLWGHTLSHRLFDVLWRLFYPDQEKMLERWATQQNTAYLSDSEAAYQVEHPSAD